MTDRYDAGFQAGYEAAREQAITVAQKYSAATGDIRAMRTGSFTAQEDRKLVVSSCQIALRRVSKAIATMTPEKNDE